MLLGKQSTSQVAVLPQLQKGKKNNYFNHGGLQEEPIAFTFQSVVYKAPGKSSQNPQEGIIQIGQIYQNQSFLQMGFPQ